MHVLGTRVPRRLGVAHSASSPKAAQALGCSLTRGLRISFGRVTCMARAASVPGCGHWVSYCWLAFVFRSGLRLGVGFVNPCQSWLGSYVGVSGHGLWCCLSFAGCLWCSWLGLGFGLLMGRVWFRARFACLPQFPAPVCGVGVRAGPGSRLCPALLGWVVGVCFLRFFFFGFVVSVAGCPCPGPCGLSPYPLSFGLGCWLFFSWCVSACFGATFPGGPLFLAWCCRFWLGGPPVPLWGSCLRCLLGGGFGRLLCCWRAVWWLWAVSAPPPPFFWGGGLPVPPSAFPGLAHALRPVCGAVGPSPLLAEGPVCYSPPLLAGFRCRWWWAFLATPG